MLLLSFAEPLKALALMLASPPEAACCSAAAGITTVRWASNPEYDSGSWASQAEIAGVKSGSWGVEPEFAPRIRVPDTLYCARCPVTRDQRNVRRASDIYRDLFLGTLDNRGSEL